VPPQHHDHDQDAHNAPRGVLNARSPSPGATFATRRSGVRVPLAPPTESRWTLGQASGGPNYGRFGCATLSRFRCGAGGAAGRTGGRSSEEHEIRPVKATRHIDILVFAGTFLSNVNPRITDMLSERAAAGVRIRLCWGDPNSQAVDIRDREEGLRDPGSQDPSGPDLLPTVDLGDRLRDPTAQRRCLRIPVPLR
jgi:hypothetical protein